MSRNQCHSWDRGMTTPDREARRSPAIPCVRDEVRHAGTPEAASVDFASLLVVGNGHRWRGIRACHRYRTNLSAKVLDFVQLGGAEGTRTADLNTAGVALSQLSYSPVAAGGSDSGRRSAGASGYRCTHPQRWVRLEALAKATFEILDIRRHNPGA